MPPSFGVVLAGGAGRRMGRAKGDLLLQGTSLAQRAALVLAEVCSEVVVSVASGAQNPARGFRAVEDERPAGRGPLAGIDAAFRLSGGADLVVLACDYPNVSSRLLRGLCALEDTGVDLVFPQDAEGRDHPLVAVWRHTAASAVARALASGRLAVWAVCDELNTRRVTSEELPGLDLATELVNWNHPEDLDPAS